LDEGIFDAIRKTKKSIRGEYELTDSLKLLLKKRKMKYIIIKVLEMSLPWDLLDANAELMESIKMEIKGIIEKNATIKGNVAIGEGTLVMSGSYIEGPVIIGNDCKIGPNCYIRPYTYIGNDCHIGNSCEIKNSIIMDRSNAPHHNYIGDSIIGYGCNFGSGTKIANLRLDEKSIKVQHLGKIIDTGKRKLGAIIGDKVKTGINSSINVGTIIGEGAFISYGARANGSIPPRAIII
jgi:bifunctional UDP-N-acetylglucosamine pyrophosphorylase/glucosamine-1-phosphate N-acetyltransferase